MTILGWIICAMMMAGASSCGVWNAILTMEKTDRVNQGLAPDKQFPVLAQGLRYFEVRREYRHQFPEGNLLARINRLTVAMFALIVGVVVVGYVFRA